MSAKPSDLPVWSTDLVYSSGPETGEDTKIEPSTDFQEEGWKPGSFPRPEYFNWYMNLAYLWCQYLSDGDLEGPINVAGLMTVDDLNVTADVDIAGDVEIKGPLYQTSDLTTTQGFENSNAGSPGFASGCAFQTIAAGVTMRVPVQCPVIEQANPKLKSFEIVCEDTLAPTVSLSVQSFTIAGGRVVSTLTVGGGLTLTSSATFATDLKSHVYVVSPNLALPSEGRMILSVTNAAGVDQDFYQLTTTWSAAKP